jgi:hypothetical protein
MTNIAQAKLMLDTLKQDYNDGCDPIKNPSRMVGHINLDTYKLKFNVSDEDIDAYCKTLTPIKLIYPKCVLCGGEWSHDDYIDKIKPVNNGHIISGVDYIETFCTSEDHTLWYCQNSNDDCSFTREIENLHGNYFNMYWRSDTGNTIHIVKYDPSWGSYPDNKALKCFDPPLPYNITDEEIWNKIEHLMVLI